MDVKQIDVGLIKAYAKNAKKHPEEQIKAIANSIKEFGFRQPLVLDKNMEIIVGHGRLAAAKLLGITSVPVVMADDLTEEQVKAFRLADNKTNESDWDLDLLAEEISDLPNLDLTDFGFNEAEILELTIDDSPEEIHVPQEQARTEIPSEPQIGFSGVPAGGMNEPSYPSVEYSGSGSPIQEPTKDDLDFYSKKAEQTLARRVIIVYSTEEEERFLKSVLAQDAEKPLAVVLDVKNIMKAQARLNEKVSD